MKVYMTGRDAPNEAACRSCRAPVTWVRNVGTGKRMPIDGGLDCVKVVAGGEGEVDLKATPSHFATCPEKKEWRKKKRR